MLASLMEDMVLLVLPAACNCVAVAASSLSAKVMGVHMHGFCVWHPHFVCVIYIAIIPWLPIN